MRDSHCQTLFQFIEWLFKKIHIVVPIFFPSETIFCPPGPFLMKYACESVSFNVKGSIKLASCFLNLKDWLQLGCLIQSNFPSSFLPLVSPLPTDVWPLFYMCVYITMLTICLPIFCCYRVSRLSKIPFTCSSLTKVHDCSGTQSSHPSQ